MHQDPVWTWKTPLFVISIGLRRKMYENVGGFNRERQPRLRPGAWLPEPPEPPTATGCTAPRNTPCRA